MEEVVDTAAGEQSDLFRLSFTSTIRMTIEKKKAGDEGSTGFYPDSKETKMHRLWELFNEA
jgi:hypothetical protein